MRRRRFLALLPALPAAAAAALSGRAASSLRAAAAVAVRAKGRDATLTAPRCYPAGIIAEIVGSESPASGGPQPRGKLTPDIQATTARLAAINNELERSYDMLARLELTPPSDKETP